MSDKPTEASAKAGKPCRRRAIMAARGAALPARYLPDSVNANTHEPKPAAPKGTCPHCGRHIGRGVNFHEKRCREKGAQK